MANLLEGPLMVLQSILGLMTRPANVIMTMTYDHHDRDQQIIFEKLEEKSTAVFKVSPLESGYAQEA